MSDGSYSAQQLTATGNKEESEPPFVTKGLRTKGYHIQYPIPSRPGALPKCVCVRAFRISTRVLWSDTKWQQQSRRNQWLFPCEWSLWARAFIRSQVDQRGLQPWLQALIFYEMLLGCSRPLNPLSLDWWICLFFRHHVSHQCQLSIKATREHLNEHPFL